MKRLFTVGYFLVFALLPQNRVFGQFSAEWLADKKVSLSNYGYCISTGPEGNVYVSGAFVGSYRNPGPQDMGCFFTCYNSSGIQQWHKEFYSIHGAIAAFNAVDSKGNIILAGPGLLKFDKSGSLIDSFPSKGLWGCDGLCVDAYDNVIIAGSCTPDSMIGDLRIRGSLQFIAKYGNNKTQHWARSCYIDQGPNHDFDLSVDAQGNIFACGGFAGTIKVSEDVEITSQYYDGFVIKYDSDGNGIWARRFGGEKSEYPQAIVISQMGESYIAGTYNGVMKADGFFTPLQTGVCDLFMVKYDTDGNLQWLKSGGGADQDKVWEMTIDDHDNIFMSGAYDSPGSFRWDGTAVTTKENDKGGLYLMQLDTDGNAVTFLNAQGGHFRDLVSDNKGHLYLTGAYGGKIDLAGKTLEGAGGMLLARLSYDMNNRVGVQENSNSVALFNIFPNPGTGFFTISLNEGLCPDATMNIYDASGHCIRSKESIGCRGQDAQCTAPAGIYLIEVRSGLKRQTRKVIIQ
jgi:hypothetical protein